jgi:hypothetical protein
MSAQINPKTIAMPVPANVILIVVTSARRMSGSTLHA